MVDALKRALNEHRESISAGLEQALVHRDRLRLELAQTEDLIREAERAIGKSSAERITLHAAIAQILEANGNQWMTTSEIRDEVNRLALYRKRDGSAVESNQIHARTRNYAQLFEKDGQRVRLRQGK